MNSLIISIISRGTAESKLRLDCDAPPLTGRPTRHDTLKSSFSVNHKASPCATSPYNAFRAPQHVRKTRRNIANAVLGHPVTVINAQSAYKYLVELGCVSADTNLANCPTSNWRSDLPALAAEEEAHPRLLSEEENQKRSGYPETKEAKGTPIPLSLKSVSATLRLIFALR